jgi:indolepyruvate ferredoxin oxidoreductase beta subunit
MNTAKLVPPVVELGLFDYPDDPIAEIRKSGNKVVAFDATSIAQELGDIRLGNTVMLGAIADHLPFGPSVLLDCVLKRFERKGEKLVELNRRAFEAGRAAVGEAEAALA